MPRHLRVPRPRVRGFVRPASTAVAVGLGLTLALPALFGAAPPQALEPVSEVQGAVATPGPTPAPTPAPTRIPSSLLDPAYAARPDENRQARFVPRQGPLAPELLSGYQWPVRVVRITLPFGPTEWGSRLVHGARFHDGIDMATFCGDRIMAAHDGVVLAAGRKVDRFMGWVGDIGPYIARLDKRQLWSTLPIAVVIDDGNGYRSLYAHFSKVTVQAGQRVRAGDLIGYEGATGRASGCHLHYGLYSPAETATFEIHPDTVKRMKLPAFQTARIDPLLVLPEPPRPKPKPSPSPPASPSP